MLAALAWGAWELARWARPESTASMDAWLAESMRWAPQYDELTYLVILGGGIALVAALALAAWGAGEARRRWFPREALDDARGMMESSCEARELGASAPEPPKAPGGGRRRL